MYFKPNGSISKIVMSSRYMAWTDTGASDHLTKMEEKDMAVMPINKGIATGIGDLS